MLVKVTQTSCMEYEKSIPIHSTWSWSSILRRSLTVWIPLSTGIAQKHLPSRSSSMLQRICSGALQLYSFLPPAAAGSKRELPARRCVQANHALCMATSAAAPLIMQGRPPSGWPWTCRCSSPRPPRWMRAPAAPRTIRDCDGWLPYASQAGPTGPTCCIPSVPRAARCTNVLRTSPTLAPHLLPSRKGKTQRPPPRQACMPG